jgi:hypothetical protein
MEPNLPQPLAHLHPLALDQVIVNNPMSQLAHSWRQAQLLDHARFSRRYFLPWLKPLSIVLIWCVKCIKRLCPFALGSEKLLNSLSVWFVQNFLSPQAQEMVLRHFAVENALIQFVTKNCDTNHLSAPYLRPTCAQELGQTQGMNTTLMHDTIILNLFAQLAPSAGWPTPGKALNFSNFDLPHFKLAPNRIHLDGVTSIYLISLFLVILFDEATLERAVHSLYLDDSLMACLSQITGDPAFKQWSPGPFVDVIRFPLDVADLLLKHIKICEYAYAHLQGLRQTRDILGR